jgi:hypothetical protein
MTKIERLPRRQELNSQYDEERGTFIYPGGHHDVLQVMAVGTDGAVHTTQAALAAGLLDKDERHLETVYSRLEAHLEARMRGAGVWDAGEADEAQGT